MSGSFDLVVQELSRPSNVHTISVRWYTSIKDIKDQLKKVFNAPPSRINLFHSSVPKALKNSIRLHDLGIEKEGHILKVSVGLFSAKSFVLFPSKDIEVDQNCKDMIAEARQGLERSQVPGKTDEFDCTGGVYFMKAASGEKVAVFKPSDEEQGMPNNPKGHAGDGVEGLRPYFQPGQGYIRETAAYLMDVNNFCRVPPTTIVHCEHRVFNYPKVQGESNEMYPKVGSLQSFVYASDLFEDISTSLISTFELQKIAILDMRLLNCDRNSANILAQRHAPTYYNRCRRDSRSSSMGSFPDETANASEEAVMEFNSDEDCDAGTAGGNSPNERFELIPIDHGYCIPSKLRIDELDWTWFYAPQISCEVDPEIKRYLASLNVEDLMRQLSEKLKIPEYNLFLLRMAHHLLVEGVHRGFTLYQVASLIARTVEDEPSFLEKVVKSAEENAYRTIEMKSNRLNNRGNSRAQSMGSRSGSFHSPSRIRPFPSASSISRDASDSVYENGSTTADDSSSVVASGSNVDLSLYGYGRLNKFIEETPDFSGAATKKHRVIHSAVNLEALGWSLSNPSNNNNNKNNNGTKNNTNNVATGGESTEGPNKYLAFAASLQQQQQRKSHSPMFSLQQPQAQRASSTLSVENVEKLTSMMVSTAANGGGSGSNSISNINNMIKDEGDDFYLAELSPHEPCDVKDQMVGLDLSAVSALSSPEDSHVSSSNRLGTVPTASEDEEGISLGLVTEGGSRSLNGSKLVVMHSVDSGATAAKLNNPRSVGISSGSSSSSGRGLTAKPVPNSKFSCGRLDEEGSECSNSFKSFSANTTTTNSTKINTTSAAASTTRETSAPIVIPVQGGISPESDTTSCEASSKESESSSPRSFGDNFFLYSESLLNRTNVPFGRSNAVEYVGLVHSTVGSSSAVGGVAVASTGSAFAAASGSGKERPFPPRTTPPSSQTSLDAVTASAGLSSISGSTRKAGKNSVSSSSGAFSSNCTSSGSDEDPETDIETQELKRGDKGSSGSSSSSSKALMMPRDTSQASLKGASGGGATGCSVSSRQTGGAITPVSLQRVASFNAFESPAIYEDKTHSRQMKMLYREQRKAVAKTSEFLELRLKFAKQAVNSFIDKETSSSSGLNSTKSKTKR